MYSQNLIQILHIGLLGLSVFFLGSAKELPTHLECIDLFNDFQLNKWTGYPENGYLYVHEASEIPVPQLQSLNGEGIFYFSGSKDFTSSFLKKQEYFQDSRPMFMYVKYYSHVANTSASRPFGQPSLHPSSGSAEYFISTDDFQWIEVIFQVDVEILKGFYLERLNVVTMNYEDDDYFLMDRMSVVQGVNIETVEQMKELCGWVDELQTTTTEVEPTLPPEFKCTEAGSFADPEDCSKFHVCQENGLGGFIDTPLDCPGGTVWCQVELQCQTPVICPCTL